MTPIVAAVTCRLRDHSYECDARTVRLVNHGEQLTAINICPDCGDDSARVINRDQHVGLLAGGMPHQINHADLAALYVHLRDHDVTAADFGGTT